MTLPSLRVLNKLHLLVLMVVPVALLCARMKPSRPPKNVLTRSLRKRRSKSAKPGSKKSWPSKRQSCVSNWVMTQMIVMTTITILRVIKREPRRKSLLPKLAPKNLQGRAQKRRS